MKSEDFCKLITWAVSYSAYDHNIKLNATRVWFGWKDGTVVHMWTNIDKFPLSLWCYEYYDLEVVKRTIHARVWYDRYDNGLNLSPAKVAGDVPPEIMEEVEWHWKGRVERVPLSEVC